MSPAEDATSIGNILISMGVISEQQLGAVLKEQQRLRQDQLIGRLLVAAGVISTGQLQRATDMQSSLRSKKPVQAAIATADLAISRHRRQSVIELRQRIEKRSDEIALKTQRLASVGARDGN